ncbi:MAG: sugar transferase [Chloroflexi bacterium]|nr:sugar transferase [Chloroflexota bacterium]
MDVCLAWLALIILSPVMLLIAIFIKLDSPGPVLFRQKRVGARLARAGGALRWDICHFYVLKFRSMVHNADESLHQAHVKAFVHGQLPSTNGEQAPFKLNDDPRITRVGRWLRTSSLDELPQLFNVLRGEMSLVGPRPVPIYETANYEVWHRERLCAWPGITGLWQVMGRSRLSFDEMVRLDIEYARSQSLALDIKILFLTIPAVLSGRGAG